MVAGPVLASNKNNDLAGFGFHKQKMNLPGLLSKPDVQGLSPDPVSQCDLA